MKTQPIFSVITISYNSEKTIERTLRSVLSQTFQDFEYIIVDGASSDRTLEIVKQYEPLFHGRLKWQSEPDKGIYDAMNKGIKRSNGQIIGIVNSDDWLEPEALSWVNSSYLHNNEPLDCLYCGEINYHWQGNIKRLCVDIEKFKRNAHLYIMPGIRHPGTFVPKAVYEKIGLFNENMRLSADQDFILRCYFSGVRFIPIKKILSNMLEGGLSTEGTKKSWEIAKADRKIMLKSFGKSGFEYWWLYNSWRLRKKIRRVALTYGLYKIN